MSVSRTNQEPRILVFTGDGKGKTTAALGLALRASGHGMKVAIVQFIKANADIGEIKALAANPLVEIRQAGLGFLPKPTDPAWPQHQAAAQAGLELARAAVADAANAVVILDEICLAVAKNLIAEADVLELLATARPDAVVVLTGRHATAGLIAAADTVTQMQCVKHGLQAGRQAQAGVEL